VQGLVGKTPPWIKASIKTQLNPNLYVCKVWLEKLHLGFEPQLKLNTTQFSMSARYDWKNSTLNQTHNQNSTQLNPSLGTP